MPLRNSHSRGGRGEGTESQSVDTEDDPNRLTHLEEREEMHQCPFCHPLLCRKCQPGVRPSVGQTDRARSDAPQPRGHACRATGGANRHRATRNGPPSRSPCFSAAPSSVVMDDQERDRATGGGRGGSHGAAAVFYFVGKVDIWNDPRTARNTP